VSGKNRDIAKEIARNVGIIKEGHYTLDELAKERNIPMDELNPRDAFAAVVDPENDNTHRDTEVVHDMLMIYNDIVVLSKRSSTKLLILETLQNNFGLVVAVIGNEVNDVPALKKAYIGITMDTRASSAVNKSADLVITDNNLDKITNAVEEGRLLFHKLKRSIIFTLVSFFIEISLFILYSQAGFFLVITVVILICLDYVLTYLGVINLLFSSLLSSAKKLARDLGKVIYQEEDGDIMELQPRNPYTETQTLVTTRVTLIAVMVNLTSILVSGFIAMKSPSIFVAWIVIKEVSKCVPWIVLTFG